MVVFGYMTDVLGIFKDAERAKELAEKEGRIR
jgi:hypothetical protein